MPVDLAECKRKLPLPVLMSTLGLGDHATVKARCPFHEDKNASFSVYQGDSGEHLWKCFAGCGSGDAVDFIAKHLGLSKGDAIRRYADLAGNATAIAQVMHVFKSAKVIMEQPSSSQPEAKLEPMTAKQMSILADWRGFKLNFVEDLAANGHIGIHDHHQIAFPVPGGLHYRKKDGSWRYTPGAKPDIMGLGDFAYSAEFFVCESTWDALSIYEALGRQPVACSRGASNIKPLLDFIANRPDSRVIAFPQNDGPGMQWLAKLAEGMGGHRALAVAKVPSPHKDVNDWRRKGHAVDGDVLSAYMDAMAYADSQELLVGHGAQLVAATGPNPAVVGGEVQIVIPSELPDQKTLTHPEQEKEQTNEEERTHHRRAGGITDERADRAVAVAGNATALGAILDSTVEFLRRYVQFPRPEQAIVTALWVAHAWTFQSFRFTPYLYVCSPEKRCGKTRLLEAIELLVPQPMRAGGISAAALRRSIDTLRPTLLLDEIDTVFGNSEKSESNEALRGALNEGFHSQGVYICCDGPKNEPRGFKVFCPKVIAGIGKNVPDTVQDRSIQIKLVRQSKELKASRFRQEVAEREASPIRDGLTLWAKGTPDLGYARPELPQELEDRQMDMTEPLFAIADKAGESWGELARQAIVHLCSGVEDQSPGMNLLRCIREIFLNNEKDSMTSADLIAALIALEDPALLWTAHWESDIKRGSTHGPSKQLALKLEPYGIKQSKFEDAVSEDVRGYYRTDFGDAWNRYLEKPLPMETLDMFKKL